MRVLWHLVSLFARVRYKLTIVTFRHLLPQIREHHREPVVVQKSCCCSYFRLCVCSCLLMNELKLEADEQNDPFKEVPRSYGEESLHSQPLGSVVCTEGLALTWPNRSFSPALLSCQSDHSVCSVSASSKRVQLGRSYEAWIEEYYRVSDH